MISQRTTYHLLKAYSFVSFSRFLSRKHLIHQSKCVSQKAILCRSKANLRIACLDPGQFPNMDHVVLFYESSSSNQSNFSQYARIEANKNEYSIHINREQGNADKGFWSLFVPVNFDVHCQQEGPAQLSISNLENSSTVVECDQSECTLHHLKGASTQVRMNSGSLIVKGYLLGNLSAKLNGDSSMTAKKIQGPRVDIQAQDGAIQLRSLYTDNFRCITRNGSIQLGSSHGTLDLTSNEGDISLDSLEGSLKSRTNTGNLKFFLNKFQTADIVSQKGNIEIQIEPNLNADIYLSSPQPPSIDQSLPLERLNETKSFIKGRLNKGGEATLTATSVNGAISLSAQTWFSSLNFKFAKDE